jgi:hypothetical protein
VKLVATLYERSFSGRQIGIPAPLEVVRYSHKAIGGPDRAELVARGGELDLWQYTAWLRSPVEIVDELGDVVWWGYVAEVRIRTGYIEYGLTLDQMANRVRVEYRDEAGDQQATAWASDMESEDAYGTKERSEQSRLERASSAAAQSERDTLLAERRFPVPTVEAGSSGQGEVAITCRGWWQALGWTYWSEASTTPSTISAQFAAIVASWQFGTGLDEDATSSVLASPERDGTKTVREELEALLATGTAAGRRMLARVDQYRRIRIYEEPAPDEADYLLKSDGTLENRYSIPVQAHRCPHAGWARLKDIIAPTANLTQIADPSRLFIEESEYDARRGSLRLQTRNIPGPWSR